LKHGEVGEEHNIHFNKGVCRIVALPFAIKIISRQKKNYGNSKYFTMEKI
jgi:hypothetical protein